MLGKESTSSDVTHVGSLTLFYLFSGRNICVTSKRNQFPWIKRLGAMKSSGITAINQHKIKYPLSSVPGSAASCCEFSSAKKIIFLPPSFKNIFVCHSIIVWRLLPRTRNRSLTWSLQSTVASPTFISIFHPVRLLFTLEVKKQAIYTIMMALQEDVQT